MPGAQGSAFLTWNLFNQPFQGRLPPTQQQSLGRPEATRQQADFSPASSDCSPVDPHRCSPLGLKLQTLKIQSNEASVNSNPRSRINSMGEFASTLYSSQDHMKESLGETTSD